MMQRKCEAADGDSFPGLIFHSRIEAPPRGQDCVVTSTPSTQYVSVTNESMLKYTVDFSSVCDENSLEYVYDGDEAARFVYVDEEGQEVPADDDDLDRVGKQFLWDGSFKALVRWDDRARTSSASPSLIKAQPRRLSEPDREVVVTFTCSAGRYARIGPFTLELRVDTMP
jgi:hypothetical protein